MYPRKLQVILERPFGRRLKRHRAGRQPQSAAQPVIGEPIPGMPPTMIPLKQPGSASYWAYRFECHRTIEEMKPVFEAESGWEWWLGDSAWYGDYLGSRPVEGVRIRLHEFGRRHSVLLQTDGSRMRRPQLDAIFLGLLEAVGAHDIIEIEPYD